MYIKKEEIIEAFIVEYKHYFKNYTFLKILIKIFKNTIFFLLIKKNSYKKLILSDVDFILLNFNKSINNQMNKSIDITFKNKKLVIFSLSESLKKKEDYNFGYYNLNDYLDVNKRQALINFINNIYRLILYFLNLLTKEELFYSINEFTYKSYYLLAQKIEIDKKIKILNFDDADSKIRILNNSIFKNNNKISIQQGLILDNSIEYFYPTSDIFLVYGQYFKDKLNNYFKFKKKIIALGVFELIHDQNIDKGIPYYDMVYISQPYVRSLFNNYIDKIKFDKKISKLFSNKKIYKKFHPFEGNLTKLHNKLFCKNFEILSNIPIENVVKKSKYIITLSSTAAFYGILHKKNIIVIKHIYSNYFDEFFKSKYLDFEISQNFKMIKPMNNKSIEQFFSGNLEIQKINFFNFFNE